MRPIAVQGGLRHALHVARQLLALRPDGAVGTAGWIKRRWYRKSVWSDYHFDMNVQVAAWPLWAANHDEEFVSMLRLLEENMENIQRSVPPAFQDECGALACE